MSAAPLVEAFDQTIAVVRRLAAEGLRRTGGGSAARELQRLLDELVARRAEVAQGTPLDPAWTGRTVRWVAEWLPDGELPLLARLGRIARVGRDLQ
ncbi:MAG: hypothetical protein ABJC36_09185 [Gemmatimonadales bacterium]